MKILTPRRENDAKGGYIPYGKNRVIWNIFKNSEGRRGVEQKEKKKVVEQV